MLHPDGPIVISRAHLARSLNLPFMFRMQAPHVEFGVLLCPAFMFLPFTCLCSAAFIEAAHAGNAMLSPTTSCHGRAMVP
jgi:hypothetical protein